MSLLYKHSPARASWPCSCLTVWASEHPPPNWSTFNLSCHLWARFDLGDFTKKQWEHGFFILSTVELRIKLKFVCVISKHSTPGSSFVKRRLIDWLIDWEKVSYNSSWPEIYWVNQAGLEFTRDSPPHALGMLRFKAYTTMPSYFCPFKVSLREDLFKLPILGLSM